MALFYRIKGGLNLTSFSGSPDPSNGSIYYDASENKFKFRQNNLWVNLGEGAVKGPATASNNSVPVFGGTSGVLIKSTGVSITGGEDLSVPGETYHGSAVTLENESEILFEGGDGRTVGLKAPATIAASHTMELPRSPGTNGQYLITNAIGQLSFAPANNLVNYSTTQTNTITNTTTTWATTGLNLSPVAGTYLAFFSGSMFIEGAGASILQTRLVVGGTEVSGSLRETRNTVVMVLGLIGGNSVDGGGSTIIMPVTIGSGQTIDVQFRLGTSGVTATAKNRSLTLLRIG